ncbi:hypothetical protein RFI_30182 [Reticulomyxa filosa]|uniref:Uncharacterized protein n=1 Tax=Reticulomyxa filosa TaxID=46433 RepID=X6M2J8_RETFI|nr:hypothetical protein RFI_30182 [Reticulomyxa filosa]|eukprot:ETO07210.1 hypothetical protein RFI_30182 [Reticulomyxa filosa]
MILQFENNIQQVIELKTTQYKIDFVMKELPKIINALDFINNIQLLISIRKQNSYYGPMFGHYELAQMDLIEHCLEKPVCTLKILLLYYIMIKRKLTPISILDLSCFEELQDNPTCHKSETIIKYNKVYSKEIQSAQQKFFKVNERLKFLKKFEILNKKPK